MGQFVDLKSADGFVLPAWVAEPDTTPRGAVVVLQEIFGVNSHIRAVADRFAARGYLAVAPAGRYANPRAFQKQLPRFIS